VHPYVSQMRKVSENNKSSREQKKQHLLSKMKQLQSASDTKQPAETETETSQEHGYEELLQQNRRLKQKVQSLEKSAAVKSAKVAALQASNRALSRECNALKIKRYEAKAAWEEANRQVKALKDRLARLEQENQALADENKKLRIWERKCHELNQEIVRHKEARQQMRTTIAQAEKKSRLRKLQLQEAETKLEQSRSLMEQAQMQAERIQQLERRLVFEAGNMQPVGRLIEQLLGKLDVSKPSHEAAAAELQRKLKKKLDTLRSFRENPIELEQRMYIHGYIVKSQDDHYFHDLEQNMYRIVPDEGEWESDLPARAVRISEDQVRIMKQYSYHYSPAGAKQQRGPSEPAIRPTRVGGSSRSIPFIFPTGLKVLLLGARNRTSYIDALEKSNVQADWYDGYEEHPRVLQQKWNAAQIIIVCTRHVPHFVLDIVNKREERVQCLDRDNVKSLLVRVRYTALKLGLI